MLTFGLLSGDFALDSGNFLTITGKDKIRQDLALALSEEFGDDRFHPQWGSIIKRYLGQLVNPQLQQLVKAEVLRVVKNYIAVQQADVLADSQVDVMGRFNTSDVVRQVLAVNTSATRDTINVVLVLETLDRTSVQIRKQLVI